MVQMVIFIVGALILVTVFVLACWSAIAAWWQHRPERILGRDSPVVRLNSEYAIKLREPASSIQVRLQDVDASAFDYFDPDLWYSGYLFHHADAEAATIIAYEQACRDYREYSKKYAAATDAAVANAPSARMKRRIQRYSDHAKLPAPVDACLTVQLHLNGVMNADRRDTLQKYNLPLSRRGRLYRVAAARHQNFLALGDAVDVAEAN